MDATFKEFKPDGDNVNRAETQTKGFLLVLLASCFVVLLGAITFLALKKCPEENAVVDLSITNQQLQNQIITLKAQHEIDSTYKKELPGLVDSLRNTRLNGKR